MLTPPGSHKDYNRFKYYSALRSGFKHMPEEGRHDESFLEPPVHVVDSELFVYNIPFYSARKFFLIRSIYFSTRNKVIFSSNNLQLLEHDDWNSSSLIALGFLAVRPRSRIFNSIYKFPNFFLHL
jgi:hypothetical protein